MAVIPSVVDAFDFPAGNLVDIAFSMKGVI
jgi:hypothetical protein